MFNKFFRFVSDKKNSVPRLLEAMRRSTGPSVLSLPRFVKRIIVVLVDVNACIFTVWLAYYLRLGYFVALNNEALFPALVSIAIAIPVFFVFGMYRIVFRYAGFNNTSLIAKAVILYGVLYFSYFTVISVPGIPRTVGIIQPVLLFLTIAVSRVVAYFWLSFDGISDVAGRKQRNVMIYGTGSVGRQLAAALRVNGSFNLCGFVDDDESIHGRLLDGYEVFPSKMLEDLKNKYQLVEIFLTPTAKTWRSKKAIVQNTHDLGLGIRLLPSLTDIADGKVEVSDLKKVDIEDLLGRDPVEPNQILMSKDIIGKIVMVTGAGGSIGSELCRQILSQKPSVLILVEVSELGLYSIQAELEGVQSENVEIVPILHSVTDRNGMLHIMKRYAPDTVYHAAAYKHVPLVEQNILQGLNNNVFGSYSALCAAIEAGVSKFVLVSTDKAVRPTNVMGASKRIAELVLQAYASDLSQKKDTSAKQPATRLTIVRFGNVLGSSGSVVPKFRQQIQDGGPVTVTHEDVTRFFMTTTEAAQLVIQAGAMASGGEVYLLNMGEPVKIMEMAKQMVELSGLSLHTEEHFGDIEIKVTGLRVGEKLYEELLIGEDAEATIHKRIMRGREKFISLSVLAEELEVLEDAIDEKNTAIALDVVRRLVPEYALDMRTGEAVFDQPQE